MSEQYRCNNCGYVFDMSKVMCPECGNGYLEHLRWTKGGDGSHWEGCAEVHWDCKVAQLEAELARRDEERNALADDNRMLSERIQRLVEGVKSRDEIIARLKEDGERFDKRAITYVYLEDTPPYYECELCFHDADEPDNILHDKSCPITIHRALMKELEG